MFFFTWSWFKEWPRGGSGSRTSPFLANLTFCQATKNDLKLVQSPKIDSSGQTNLEVNLFTKIFVSESSRTESSDFPENNFGFVLSAVPATACLGSVMMRQAWLSLKSTLFCRSIFFISSNVALDDDEDSWSSLASKAWRMNDRWGGTQALNVRTLCNRFKLVSRRSNRVETLLSEAILVSGAIDDRWRIFGEGFVSRGADGVKVWHFPGTEQSWACCEPVALFTAQDRKLNPATRVIIV